MYNECQSTMDAPRAGSHAVGHYMYVPRDSTISVKHRLRDINAHVRARSCPRLAVLPSQCDGRHLGISLPYCTVTQCI
jgi:hypothetical protein